LEVIAVVKVNSRTVKDETRREEALRRRGVTKVVVGPKAKLLQTYSQKRGGRALIRAIVNYYKLRTSEERNTYYKVKLEQTIRDFELKEGSGSSGDAIKLICELIENRDPSYIDSVRCEIEKVIGGDRKKC
jgi:hypothetical protein